MREREMSRTSPEKYPTKVEQKREREKQRKKNVV
jgi:hypothetical protein